MALIGSSDSEGSHRFDSNWGAPYLLETPESSFRDAGVKRLFGVPVFDGAQGLGYRLPNFASTQHLSPLILLSKWVPAFFLSQLMVWWSLLLAALAIHHSIRSWFGHYQVWRMVPVVASALTPVVVYLLFNDWSIPLAGMLSSFAIVAALSHRSLQCGSSQDQIQTAALFLAALGTQFATHPRYVLLLIPLYIVWVKPIFRLCQSVFRTRFLLSATCLTFTALALLAMEYFAISYLLDGMRQAEPSSLSVLDWYRSDSLSWRRVILGLVTPIALPLLRLGFSDYWHLLHSRTEFLNLWFPVAMVLLIGGRGLRSANSVIATRCLYGIYIGIAWMMFGPLISHLLPWLSTLFLQDGWDLSFIVAFVGALGASASIPLTSVRGRGHRTLSHPRLLSVSIAYLIGSVMAVALPLGLILKAPVLNGELPRRDWKIQQDSLSNGFGLDSASVTNSGRAGWTTPLSKAEWGCIPRTTWEKRTGLSHPVVLAREGIPVIESLPFYRYGGLTLRTVGGGIEEMVYACDAILKEQCDSEVLDFLGYREFPQLNLFNSCSMVFDSQSKDGLRNATSPSSTIHDGKSGAISYHNYYIDRSRLTFFKSFDCGLLGGCLSPSISGTTVSSDPPWAICRTDCWFTYKVFDEKTPGAALLLLPARFDASLVVTADEVTRKTLRTSSYRGLLAVDLAEVRTPTTLQVVLRSDFSQWRIMAMPYIMLITLCLCIFAFVRSARFRMD